ncbi:MAG: helix-turn-helix transcriptional regulator [Ruminococcaceae bacterium]|nr:helix-turn-helix transcriptional regulator [Oscillospiraceae bacterium]
MEGIDLDKLIIFKHSSLRYFSKGEHHIDRLCNDDVLLMVFDGVLRFTENGTDHEVSAGEYHIQKHGSDQRGPIPSDSPKYLYVHFIGKWAEEEKGNVLPRKGSFDYGKLKELMEELDTLSHGESSLLERSQKFYEILLKIGKHDRRICLASEIHDYIVGSPLKEICLKNICKKFSFSENHIINIFKKEYGTTPQKYINRLKISRAKHLLELSSDTLESIALNCGFNDYTNFYKLFCRENGISPSEWRAKVQTSGQYEKSSLDKAI